MVDYLAFATVLVLFRRRGVPLLLLAGLALACIVMDGARLNENVAISVPRCIMGFVAGHFTYAIWRRYEASSSRGPGTVVQLAVLALVGAFVTLAANSVWELAAPLVFAVAVLTFAFEGGAVARILEGRGFVWLGRLSYAIYMVHWLVREMIGRGIGLAERLLHIRMTHAIDPALIEEMGSGRMIDFGGQWGGDAILLLSLAVSVAAAAAAWALIEVPCERRIRAWGDRWVGRAHEAAPAAG